MKLKTSEPDEKKEARLLYKYGSSGNKSIVEHQAIE